MAFFSYFCSHWLLEIICFAFGQDLSKLPEILVDNISFIILLVFLPVKEG